MITRPRIAVVSPFLDKRHGTERCVCEQIEHLAQMYGYEIHIYSRAVADIAGVEIYQNNDRSHHELDQQDRKQGRIWWHRVPDIPGPGLFRYIWWFVINHLWRWWDKKVRGLSYDLVFSPGINCLDADFIAVHIVFAEFFRLVKQGLRLNTNPIRSWPWLIHRQIYYHLIMLLEQLVYPRNKLVLTAISKKTAADLGRFYKISSPVPVIYYGLDLQRFNPQRRMQLRPVARTELALPDAAHVVLLVGNDWKKKGLPSLLKAIGRLQQSDIWLLVVGRDQTAPYQALIEQYNLQGRVLFLPLRADVEWYYAAADVYAGPSLEDAFALPPAEAMACGVPAIVSSQAGVSELVTDGKDALTLKDPQDVAELSELLFKVYTDPLLCRQMGQAAVETFQHYSWRRNTAMIHMLLNETMRRKMLTRQ